MKLTKEQAIDYSIEQWEWIVKTGGGKYDFLNLKGREDISYGCFLCEYTCQREKDRLCRCKRCPYDKKFGFCCAETAPFHLYCSTHRDKKYAKLFLKQLKELKK